MFRNRLIGLGVIALIVVGVAAVNSRAADEPAKPATPARGEGFMRGGNGLALIQSDVVAKDLDLSAEQKESLTKIGDEARKQRTDLRESLKDASREDRRAKLSALEKETTGKVDAVLNDKQRAPQGNQAASPRRFCADRTGSRRYPQAHRRPKDETDRPGERAARRHACSLPSASGDRAAAREKTASITKESNSKMQAVLTTEQVEQFDKMQGKKLDVAEIMSSLRRPSGSDSSKSESK